MIKSLILAYQFLTRLPINIMIDFNDENLSKATMFFPLVGITLGGLIYVVYYLFSFINIDVASIMTVVALIVYTGGLHLDGLSDTFDGFFSNKSREEILEIMRDSRIGAFGVISLIVILLLKYVLISNIPSEYIGPVLIFSLGNSRTAQVYEMCFKENARSEGIGYMFNTSGGKRYAGIGISIYLIFLAIYNYRFLFVFLLNFLVAEYIYKYSYKKIQGHTGDVLGATAEIGEVISLLGFLGLIAWI